LALPGIARTQPPPSARSPSTHPASAVDGNVERVVARRSRWNSAAAAKPNSHARAAVLVPKLRSGDYAQADDDLGATVCTRARRMHDLSAGQCCAAASSTSPRACRDGRQGRQAVRGAAWPLS